MRAAHPEETSNPPPSAGHLHQPLDAGESGMMAQQRGEARKGGDVLTAKPSPSLLCAVLSARCFCRLRQIGLSG